MDKNNNVSEKGQIVTASLVSKSAIACGVFLVWNGQYLPKWFMEGTMAKQQQGHGWQRHIDACGEWSKAVRSV